MGSETGRALVLGTLAHEDGFAADAIAALLAEGGLHAPSPLTELEHAALAKGPSAGVPPWVPGNYPAWLHDTLATRFGTTLSEEMTVLAARAPLDLRVNSLKANAEHARAVLRADGLDAAPCRFAPLGLRLPPGSAVTRSRAYLDGLVEVQDEGSQIASLLAGAEPGMTVIDLAAGAGGKSLALAASMGNAGQIIAADIDAERLARLAPRAARAGARIIERRVLRPWAGGADPDFPDLPGGVDLVVLDAPCSGSGTWRRNPESKWRLTPDALTDFARIQASLLDRAARLVRPGGRLAYMTCSILEAENSGAIHAFFERNAKFAIILPEEALNRSRFGAISGLSGEVGIMLSPARTGTDGFFIALLRRKAEAAGVDGS